MTSTTSAYDAARVYRRHGWYAVPVPAGQKRPHEPEWENLRIDSEPDMLRWFGGGSNIGLILGAPSGNLVDVDLDATEAIALASFFLPPTERIHGRSGKPSSHRWYITDRAVNTSHFKQLKDEMIVELRATGGQTIVPPSKHPSGDIYTWESEGEPARVTADDLLMRVKRLAAAALLAKNWPKQGQPKGGRHDASLALGGMLLRAGWSDDDTAHFVECVAHAGGDSEAKQRAKNVRTTTARVHQGKPATGGKTLAQLMGKPIVERVRDWLGLPVGGAAPPNAARRPEIVVTNDDAGPVIDAAEAALVAASSLEIYQRGGALVRVIRDGSAGRSGLKRDPLAAVIGIIPTEHLFELASRAARFVIVKETEEGPERRAVLPPKWVVTSLAARSTWGFKALEAIVESPCLRPDGSILDTPGFDDATGILFEATGEFESVPDKPSPENIREALALLLDAIADFPFVEGCDRSAALAAILTPLARPAMAGPAPLFAVRAPTAGTGKSLMAHVVAILATGRRSAIMTQPKDEDEERKRILAIGLEGERVVLIDNVERPLGSDVLAAALTGTTFKDRLLGTNKTAVVPLLATWFASGNNLVVKGDLGRRVVPIDLDAKVERPESRSGFRHPDLLEYVRHNRPTLVRAALTLLRGYLANARNPVELSEFGSFESWSRLVRGTVVWLGEPDPCAGRERIRADSDPELSALRETLSAWHEFFGEVPYTLSEVAERVRKPSGWRTDSDLSPDERRAANLRECLCSLIPKNDGEHLDSKKLGYALRKYKRRIVSGYKLDATEPGKNGVKWCVLQCFKGDDGDDGVTINPSIVTHLSDADETCSDER